jgi:regulator of protease activity HflC (stomatin/prohibitin superfamily)
MDARGATTADEYVAKLPDDRRDAIAKVRDVVNANLPAGYQEGILYGMIGWYVPLARFPETYNGQPLGIAGLASQKGYMALYLNGVYSDPAIAAWFRGAFAKAGKKLDMGKSCVRFKSIDALPLDVIAETIRRIPVEKLLRLYMNARASAERAKAARAKAKQPAAKAKKPAAKARKPAAKVKKPAAKKAKAKKR